MFAPGFIDGVRNPGKLRDGEAEFPRSMAGLRLLLPDKCFRHEVFHSWLRLIKKHHDGALAGCCARKLAPNS